MNEPIVLVGSQGRVGVITLNRPKQLNALNDALILFERHALYERFASADAFEGIHAFLGKRSPEFQHR